MHCTRNTCKPKETSDVECLLLLSVFSSSFLFRCEVLEHLCLLQKKCQPLICPVGLQSHRVLLIHQKPLTELAQLTMWTKAPDRFSHLARRGVRVLFRPELLQLVSFVLILCLETLPFFASDLFGCGRRECHL